MRRGLPWFSALLALSLATAACTGGGEDALVPTATLGPAPTTTSTTARPIDVSVIPDDPVEIDEAYVQAVVDALFAVDAQATAIFVETGELDEEGVDYLRAIYTEEEVDRQVNIWSQGLAEAPDEFLAGTLRHEVQKVIDRADDCVFLEVASDYSEVTTRDTQIESNYLGLTSKDDGDDPKSLNVTAWMMFMDGVNLDGSRPDNPCAGR